MEVTKDKNAVNAVISILDAEITREPRKQSLISINKKENSTDLERKISADIISNNQNQIEVLSPLKSSSFGPLSTSSELLLVDEDQDERGGEKENILWGAWKKFSNLSSSGSSTGKYTINGSSSTNSNNTSTSSVGSGSVGVGTYCDLAKTHTTLLKIPESFNINSNQENFADILFNTTDSTTTTDTINTATAVSSSNPNNNKHCNNNKSTTAASSDSNNSVINKTGIDHRSFLIQMLECFGIVRAMNSSSSSFDSHGGEEPVVCSRIEDNNNGSYYCYELLDPSEILEEEHVKQIGAHLPPSAIGNPWALTFSTSRDGFSLQNLYRKMLKLNSPVLIMIKDTLGRVFGAMVSNPLKISSHFYGTSHSFLFRFHSKDFEVYTWSGENLYFIQGNDDSIVIGAGNGKFGLWLDNDLNKGRTEECQTYSSPPLVDESDFVIANMECWSF